MSIKTKSISFRYQSVENMLHLLCDIQFEKSSNPREISIYHKRFDKDDEFFGQVALELFPEGKTIDVPDIDLMIKYIKRFMDKDEKTKQMFAEYDMSHYKSYVYFKPDHLVVPCSLASHSLEVKKILCDYFKGFDENELTEEYLRKFIKENFIIASDFTTVDKIANDWKYLIRCIVLEQPYD